MRHWPFPETIRIEAHAKSTLSQRVSASCAAARRQALSLAKPYQSPVRRLESPAISLFR